MGRLTSIALAAVLSLAFAVPAAAEQGADSFSSAPRTNDGKKWRIGYYEGGPTENYYEYLASVVRGLMDLGWIEKSKLPSMDKGSTSNLWTWLAESTDSKYIQFVDDAFYSANWDQPTRKRVRQRVITRVNEVKDLNLIFALGTWAGKDLANDEHSTPVMVISASDPLGSKIIKSIDDSGLGHIHARVDPLRYDRQLSVFHDIIGFKKLGVAYEDSPDGRGYAAMDTVEKVARERNFEVVRCFTKSDISDQDLAGQSVVDCFETLVKKVDAIYVTNQGGVNDRTLPELVRTSNRSRIPTFSQGGSKGVEQGFLLSISRPSFKPVGLFLAATAGKVLNGAEPSQLGQLFEESPNIAINLKSAELIGLYLYADVLAAADEIYREIGTGQ